MDQAYQSLHQAINYAVTRAERNYHHIYFVYEYEVFHRPLPIAFSHILSAMCLILN